MKSILRTARHYIISAFIITISILLLNLFVFAYCIVSSKDSEYVSILKIVQGFSEQNNEIIVSKESTSLIEDHFAFAMILDDQGNIIYSQSLPEELNRQYSLKDIAAASRWYLKDYPVWTWNCEQGLLILGKSKNSIWKFLLEYSQSGIDTAIVALPLCNLLLLSIFCLFFGLRFYHSMRPVGQGIESLSLQKKTNLKENGIMGDLKKKINQTSSILEQQNSMLAKRDDARTQWIAGVSHDIRTPLSMIMGYADTLSSEDNLTAEQTEKLLIIRNQSIQIKELIEDLNMTSKLEYQMQPLREKTILLSAWLRRNIADYYNQDLDERYHIELNIDNDTESRKLSMDEKLMDRALRNLIGNSIRHNKDGCDVYIHAGTITDGCLITIKDTGKGLPAEVLQAFQQRNQENAPHIMGLYLVDKIIKAHHGSFTIQDTRGDGMSASIILPFR